MGRGRGLVGGFFGEGCGFGGEVWVFRGSERGKERKGERKVIRNELRKGEP